MTKTLIALGAWATDLATLSYVNVWFCMTPTNVEKCNTDLRLCGFGFFCGMYFVFRYDCLILLHVFFPPFYERVEMEVDYEMVSSAALH